jgi:hypothetical protein
MNDKLNIERCNQSCCKILPKLVNLRGLKAVEHLAMAILFLEIASVI